jgi:hypothetical protein
MPPTAPPELTAVRNHYIQHFGQPQDVLELSKSPEPRLDRLEVALFAPAGPSSAAVLATVGVSRAMTSDGRRVELLLIQRPMPAKELLDASARLLGKVALHTVTQEPPLATGAVLDATTELAPLSTMDRLMVLPPINLVESFHRVTRPDGRKVEILWLVPLHASEARVATEQGVPALMELLSGSDLADWRRGPGKSLQH